MAVKKCRVLQATGSEPFAAPRKWRTLPCLTATRKRWFGRSWTARSLATGTQHDRGQSKASVESTA